MKTHKSSYQKQKEKIQSLQEDINALLGKKGPVAKVEVSQKYTMLQDFENAVWAGTRQQNK